MRIEVKGGGVFWVAFIVLAVLKLTGVIDWSWWWVTAPIWVPIVLVLGTFALYVVSWSVIKLFNR